jgi:hypothetical protein
MHCLIFKRRLAHASKNEKANKTKTVVTAIALPNVGMADPIIKRKRVNKVNETQVRNKTFFAIFKKEAIGHPPIRIRLIA